MKAFPERRTVLFDFDGTLIDQFRTIHACFNAVEERFGLPLSSFDEIRLTIGISMPLLVEKMVGSKHKDEAIKAFRDHYETIMHEEIIILPGVEWILKSLNELNYKVALFTNKPGKQAREIIDRLSMSSYFHSVIAQEDTPYSKPQPEFSRYALKHLEACHKTALLIGDSPVDLQAGGVVGMPVYIVTTGSHSREELEQEPHKPHGIYNTLYELGPDLFDIQAPAAIS